VMYQVIKGPQHLFQRCLGVDVVDVIDIYIIGLQAS
jgi:hypothetical protein